MTKEIKITWRDVMNGSKNLVKQIKKEDFKPTRVLAIADGGLILGVILAKIFDIPLDVIKIESYKGKTSIGANKVIYNKFTPEEHDRVLIVDEIIDSGNTMKLAITRVRHKKTNTNFEFLPVCLIKKKKAYFRGQKIIKYKEVNDNKWRLFPWEVK